MTKLTIPHTMWNLKLLFDGDDDPEMAMQRKKVEEESYKFINKWKDRSDYLEKPEVLREAMDEYEGWVRNYGTDGDEGVYLSLRSAQDQNDPAIKAKINKVVDFSNKIWNDIQFFTMRIAKIPSDRQQQFLNYEGLKDYRHYLEKSFAEAKYLLSEPEEKIMNLKSMTAHSNWVRMTSGFLAKEEREILDEDGKVKTKNYSEISSLVSSKNKEVRDSAAKVLNEIFVKHVDVGEAEINSILADKKVNDELRGMARPDLGRHLGDDIDSEVVDALLEAVTKRFDISRNYYELKAKLFGVPKLEYHERSVPYGDQELKYSFDDAASLVYEVFKNLDQEFGDIFESYLKNGQIDIFPRKGKKSGAFCSYHSPRQPTFILLNHTDKLSDVLTLAHELGHGINGEMMRKKQNAINFDTPMSTAEVASTFMEDFVLEELKNKADEETKLALMMMKLNDDIGTISRQVACYRFEQDLHQNFRDKGYLSKDDIGQIFQRSMAAQIGEAVKLSPGSENWWIGWPHIRMFFYVYSYASGLLISKSLQNSVKKDPKFIGQVKEFLSAGESDSPKNIFAKLGIDITDARFWDQGLDEVETLLRETEELANKLGKIKS